MSDTQRTRSDLLALLADNSVGGISAQDVRDFAVTVMQEEFVNANDFWCGPSEFNLTSDYTTRGYHLYSQIVSPVLANGMSFGCVYNKNASNVWSTANVSASINNYYLGMPNSEYDAGDNSAAMLIWGIVYNSGYSVRNVSAVGYPVYLLSALDNSVSVTIPANSLKVIGRFMPSGQDQNTAVGTGKLFFNPTWEIRG